jgi:glutamyl-tRNA reductase
MDTEAVSLRKHTTVLGINHTTSRTELRDKLLFTGPLLRSALDQLAHMDSLSEAVILSTCNRVELYVVTSRAEKAREVLIDFLAEFHKIKKEEFEPHAYFFRCNEAVEHLFAVASSLDSMVIGEDQILGQVKEAFRLAQEGGCTGPVLNKLFLFAITAGKRARAETKIGEGAVSISLAAVELARKTIGKLEHHAAMVIGAGEMSELTARHLRTAGIGKLYFANRSIERASDLASQYGGIPLKLEERSAILPECDMVISSTASPHYILNPEEMREIMIKRKNRSMLLIDIAAPRDIHPDVGRLYNVFLYTIDDLAQVAKFNAEMRAKEIIEVRKILDEEMRNYFEWYDYLKVQPTLVSLRRRFEAIRDAELNRFAAEIASLPQPVQKLIQDFANSLTKEYLQAPSKKLKELSSTPEGLHYSDSLSQLFNLQALP